jgi:hypothetical protein
MRDPLMLDAVAEVLSAVVSRHASVVDSGSTWLRPDEEVSDHLGNTFTVSAALHLGEARDAARDVLDRLAVHGLGVHREPPKVGNGLGTRLARLSAELTRASGQPSRVQAIAAQMTALANEAAERDVALVPAHLRLGRSGLPDGVASLCERRRA